MNHSLRRFVRLLAVCAAATALATGRAAHADSITKRVDQLFERWNHRDTPGCALAVVRDGRIVYKRGYGMADLEHSIPISPTTIFHIASVSKQFTAFAILLLAEQGRLSLDDDIRKYLPELHDFGKTITIRNVLQHTSGLRDQWDLLMLGGWRIDDVITEDDILGLVWRQKHLNYDPGSEFLYCNTGYTLAAKVVERVSGRALPEFARERIFVPLDMARTHFHADYREIVRDRAYSYEPAGQRVFKNAILSYGNVGATSLLTTVEDLARWDRNFYDRKVGSEKVIGQIQEPGRLKDGRPIGYALGLGTGEYRGLRTVEHDGGDAGFRSTLVRFPEQRFSVIILANVADFDPGGMARRVADIYLADKLKPVERPAAATGKGEDRTTDVPVPAERLDAYCGEYRVFPGMIVTVSREGNHLDIQATGQPKTRLFASTLTDFYIKVADATVKFFPPENGKTARILIHKDGQEIPAERFVRKELSREQWDEFAGDYYSDELGVIYTVSVDRNELRIRYPRGTVPMHFVDTDQFEAAYPLSKIRFLRDSGRITGLTIDTGRVRSLRFVKSSIQPVR